jgi:hypothetical protein
MSDDDIERLLREVDATMAGKPAPSSGAVAPSTSSGSSAATRSGSSPVRTGLVAGAVSGVGVGTVTFLLSWLPLIGNPLAAGGGAFVGAFLTGTVLSWRNRR